MAANQYQYDGPSKQKTYDPTTKQYVYCAICNGCLVDDPPPTITVTVQVDVDLIDDLFSHGFDQDSGFPDCSGDCSRYFSSFSFGSGIFTHNPDGDVYTFTLARSDTDIHGNKYCVYTASPPAITASGTCFTLTNDPTVPLELWVSDAAAYFVPDPIHSAICGVEITSDITWDTSTVLETCPDGTAATPATYTTPGIFPPYGWYNGGSICKCCANMKYIVLGTVLGSWLYGILVSDSEVAGCPPPVGACCHGGDAATGGASTCELLSAEDCHDLYSDGHFYGEGTTCADVDNCSTTTPPPTDTCCGRDIEPPGSLCAQVLFGGLCPSFGACDIYLPTLMPNGPGLYPPYLFTPQRLDRVSGGSLCEYSWDSGDAILPGCSDCSNVPGDATVHFAIDVLFYWDGTNCYVTASVDIYGCPYFCYSPDDPDQVCWAAHGHRYCDDGAGCYGPFHRTLQFEKTIFNTDGCGVCWAEVALEQDFECNGDDPSDLWIQGCRLILADRAC